MVHALNEIWRVLVPDGVLIDLRPYGGDLSTAVVKGNAVHAGGMIDISADVVDDRAADAAVETVLERGLFRRERSASFDLFAYWDTIGDLEEFVASLSDAIVTPETLAEIEALLAAHSPNARIRCRFNMIIGKYRKISGHR